MSDSLWPHGLYSPWTLQARTLEWVAFPFIRRSSHPRDWIQVSLIAGGLFTSWATREGQESWNGIIHPSWRRDRLPTPVFLGFPCGSAGKESTLNVGDLGSIPGLERSSGEGKGYPLQYSWPREFYRLYSPWGRKESDTTEWLSLSSFSWPDLQMGFLLETQILFLKFLFLCTLHPVFP